MHSTDRVLNDELEHEVQPSALVASMIKKVNNKETCRTKKRREVLKRGRREKKDYEEGQKEKGE